VVQGSSGQDVNSTGTSTQQFKPQQSIHNAGLGWVTGLGRCEQDLYRIAENLSADKHVANVEGTGPWSRGATGRSGVTQTCCFPPTSIFEMGLYIRPQPTFEAVES
jgi:hypothetical protein